MSAKPNIAIHIDRVVVDGARANTTDALRIQKAIEKELNRLFSAGDINVGSRLERSVTAKSPTLTAQNTAAGLGEEIAKAIHGAVTKGQ